MKYLKWILGIVLLVGISFVVTHTGEVKEWLQQFLEWVQQLGFWGAASLAVLYAVAVVFMFPASILTLGAGFAF